MRVLFTSSAARPHLFPVVPLAWACRAAGHEVRVASGVKIAADIVHTGLPAVLSGGVPVHPAKGRAEFVASIYSQEPWPHEWPVNPHLLNDRQREHLERLANAVIAGSAAMVADFVGFAQWWRPDIVVYEAVCYAGAVTAAVLGIPGVRHLFGSASLPCLELRDGRPLSAYVQMFRRFGVDVTTSAAMTVDPTPPSMRLADAEQPWRAMRYVPYNGSGDVPRWLAGPRSRPRVCVTWGHTMVRALGGAAAGPYRQAIDAIATLDVDIVVVASGEQLAQLGELPKRVRTSESTPLSLVLPYCDLIMHQGGDGTTLTAAAQGLPQLAITRKPDAEVPAGRLAMSGAGIHLRYQELRHNRSGWDLVRTAVEKLLADQAYRDAAGRLRAEIEGQPTPAELVPVLEETA
ncbi:nucleotide disphospho-sugar-binding domain-containing protein [Actinocrispum wychmicini]|uniref:Glycosyltransferase n=1 Tax=Actinocrispum wychmicini TaxID=1213861 RepID=A0A4R2IN15_9PSEU|nr:nucleotide disphospho-sugar-binding domain-containing protein [Actinocrispum wychmicini]TCO46631.1 glycosyltransferase [Actinocrispum wychmicini]